MNRIYDDAPNLRRHYQIRLISGDLITLTFGHKTLDFRHSH
jgi:hypothetical protein